MKRRGIGWSLLSLLIAILTFCGMSLEIQATEAGNAVSSNGAFYYEEYFEDTGVKVIISAEENVVPQGAEVEIIPIQDAALETVESILEPGIIADMEAKKAAAEASEVRTIFDMYKDLQPVLETTYAYDFYIYYTVDGETCLFEPEDGEVVNVSFEIPKLSEAVADELKEVDLHYIPEEMLTASVSTFSLRPEETVQTGNAEKLTDKISVDGNVLSFNAEHFSMYSVTVSLYATQASQESITAQNTVWNLINGYVDPAMHLDDPYLTNSYYDLMTEEEYAELKAVAQNVVAGCTTQFQKIEAINKFVANRTYYDYDYYDDRTTLTNMNPYDVYTNKYTVCSGYARLMRTLYISLGIPCMNLIGENHEFNAVYDSDNDRWVFADATWCSGNIYEYGNFSAGSYRPAYFNSTPEYLAGLNNHEIYGVNYIANNSLYYKMTDNGDVWTDMDWSMGVLGAQGTPSSITIPATALNMEVTSIASGAFQDNATLKTADLSNATNLTEISSMAFRNATALETVTFPSSLKAVGYWSFAECGALKSADLSKTVVDFIDISAFYKCSSMTDLKLPDTLKTISDWAFANCAAIKSVDLSRTVTESIGESAFMGCSSATELKLPNTLKTIGAHSLRGFSSLTKIDISNTQIKVIPEYAFAYANNAYLIMLPNTISSVGVEAFARSATVQKDTVLVTKATEAVLDYDKNDVYDYSVSTPWHFRPLVITPSLYTIAFNGNGATSGSVESMDCGYNISYTLPQNAFKKTNYTFAGWNTKADGSGTKYANLASVKSLTSTNNRTVTLYAQWEANKYNIKFNANGGTGTMSAMSNCKYDTSYKLTANTFKRTGCTFAGWNTKADGTGKTYTNTASVKGLSTTNGATVTLYAQWTPVKPYKITNVVSGVHVYWTAAPNATKYGLWRSETGVNGTYKWIANPTVAHFTDTKVESGKTYYYKVTLLNTSSNTHSAKSAAIGVTYVSTPDITLRVNRATGIGLGWEKIKGATGYAIYRKPYSGSGDWVRIATIKDPNQLTWDDTSVKVNNGTVYKYTIRALAGSDRKTLSGCRGAGRTMVRLTSRNLTSVTKTGTGSVKCSWSTTTEATGYEVRFMVGSTVYKTYTVGSYRTGTKTFTGLKAGQTYKIQVRTYKKVDGVGSFYSAWSTAKEIQL